MSQPSAASQGNSSVIHNTDASQRSTAASTQQTAEEEINSRGGIVLVDYEKEKQLFEKFMREHTIVVTDFTTATTRNRGRSNNDDSDSDENDDDDVMWEPLNEDEYGTGVRRRRIPAYAHHLQRICNREYYEPDKRVFILEVPLQEVANFGQADLAQRAANNTLRYEEVFSQVVDSLLANLT